MCKYFKLFSKVLDPKILANYCYRDDAMLIYKAIDAYVQKVLCYYYGQYIRKFKKF